MEPLRLAVIGVGALGKHHARILAGMPDVTLLAVADLNRTLGQQIANDHGARYVADFHQILDEIDAAVVAVPTTAHQPVASTLLARGVPVLVEKPLAPTLAQARSLLELAERHGTLLQVGHVERFNPAFRAAKPYLTDVVHLQCDRASPYTFRSTDIGVVHDLMIHDIDLALRIVGSSVREVEAFGVCYMGEHEDQVTARITFENGCVADLKASRISPQRARRMQAWSASGWVDIDFTSADVTAYRRSELLKFGPSPLERARQPGADVEQLKADVFGKYLRVEKPEVVKGDALTDELAEFVSCVRTGRTPQVDGTAAVRAMEVADRILESVASHQWHDTPTGQVGPHFAIPTPARKLAG